MKKRTEFVLMLCTAAVLVGVAGYVIKKHRDQRFAQFAVCRDLGTSWSQNVHLVSTIMRTMVLPDMEQALKHPKAADPRLLKLAQEQVNEAAAMGTQMDRDRAAGMPHLDTYLAVREQMRRRFWEFADFDAPGANQIHLKGVAEQQAISMGVSICRNLD